MTSSISDTAFLTTWGRSNDPVLSKDSWAHLWLTKSVRQFGEEYRKAVAAHEQLTLCLRNRFFADALEKFESGKPLAFQSGGHWSLVGPGK